MNMWEYIAPELVIDNDIRLALLMQIVSREPLRILITGDGATGKYSILDSVCSLVPEALFDPDKFEDSSLVVINDYDGKHETCSIPRLLAAKRTDKSRCLLFSEADDCDEGSFDLVFRLKDDYSRETDRMVARAHLNKKRPVKRRFAEFVEGCRKFHPRLTLKSKRWIENCYMNARNSHAVTPLFIRSLMTMSKASAMIRHSDDIIQSDVALAASILLGCVNKITGDVEEVLEVIRSLGDEGGCVKVHDIKRLTMMDNIGLERAIGYLVREGLVVEPMAGYVKEAR